MAQEPRRKKSLEQLRTDLARSREQMERGFSGLRDELDFPRKIRRSFQRQTGTWIAAVAVIGLLVAIRPARKKTIYVDGKKGSKTKNTLLEAGFLLSAARVAMTFLQPMIVKFVTKKVRDFAGSEYSRKKW